MTRKSKQKKSVTLFTKLSGIVSHGEAQRKQGEPCGWHSHSFPARLPPSYLPSEGCHQPSLEVACKALAEHSARRAERRGTAKCPQGAQRGFPPTRTKGRSSCPFGGAKNLWLSRQEQMNGISDAVWGKETWSSIPKGGSLVGDGQSHVLHFLAAS